VHLDYVTRHVNQQTPQNLPFYRQNYITPIIGRELSSSSRMRKTSPGLTVGAWRFRQCATPAPSEPQVAPARTPALQRRTARLGLAVPAPHVVIERVAHLRHEREALLAFKIHFGGRLPDSAI